MRADPNDSTGYGKVVDVKYPDGSVVRLAHLGSYTVHVGQKVNLGDVLGTVGRSGVESANIGTHVHVEVIKGDAYSTYNGKVPSSKTVAGIDATRIDPAPYFNNGVAGGGVKTVKDTTKPAQTPVTSKSTPKNTTPEGGGWFNTVVDAGKKAVAAVTPSDSTIAKAKFAIDHPILTKIYLGLGLGGSPKNKNLSLDREGGGNSNGNSFFPSIPEATTTRHSNQPVGGQNVPLEQQAWWQEYLQKYNALHGADQTSL